MVLNNLNVKNSDVYNEYYKMSDIELNKYISSIIRFNIKIHSIFINLFCDLISDVPFTRKQSLMFLTKMDNHSKRLSYMYRHLVRCAGFYGVPNIIINNYLKSKKNYLSSKYNKVNYKNELHKNGKILLECTLEMVQRSKSRKFKLNNIIDKIIDKEN
jgi:hypothetical protein